MIRFAVPLLALALAGCASTHPISPQIIHSQTAFARAQPVTVTLANFKFIPKHIRLRAGTPYALHLVNTASGGHNFTAPEFFAAAKVAPEDAAEIADGQVELAGGASKTVRLLPAAGTYKLTCTHPGHALLGMTGDIVVE